jgi:hypothetical protein
MAKICLSRDYAYLATGKMIIEEKGTRQEGIGEFTSWFVY